MRRQKLTNIQKWLLSICCLMSALYTGLAMASVQTITHGKSLMISCQQAMIVINQDTAEHIADQNSAFVCMAYLSSMMATAQHANDRAKLRYSLITEGRGNWQDFGLYCFDWQLSYQKVAHIVLEFGSNNPAYLRQPAHKMAIRALQTAFPCR